MKPLAPILLAVLLAAGLAVAGGRLGGRISGGSVAPTATAPIAVDSSNNLTCIPASGTVGGCVAASGNQSFNVNLTVQGDAGFHRTRAVEVNAGPVGFGTDAGLIFTPGTAPIIWDNVTGNDWALALNGTASGDLVLKNGASNYGIWEYATGRLNSIFGFSVGTAGGFGTWTNAGVLTTVSLSLSSTLNRGTCTLDGASPSKCTATVTAGAFCLCVPVGTTAAIAGGGAAQNLVSTTLTCYGPDTATHAVNYQCL